jgi:hypothetical protein
VTAYAFGDRLDALGPVGRETTGLQLLLLFGSRARSNSHRESDWDLGCLAAPQVDPAALHGRMVEVLGTNAIDLIDLLLMRLMQSSCTSGRPNRDAAD